MGAAHRVGEQHGIEPEEESRRQRRATEPHSAGPDQRDATEAGQRRDGLEDPDRRREADPPERQAREGEERPVCRGVEGPAHVYVGGIGGRGREGVHVRIEAVHRVEPGVADVVEEIAGEERRRDHEDQVEQHDRADTDPHLHRVGESEHAEVADAQRDEDDAELGAAHRDVEAVQRAPERVRQPVMDVESGPVVLGRGAGRHQEAGHHHSAQQRVGDQGSPPGLQPGKRGQGGANGRRRPDRGVSRCGSGLHGGRGS